MHSSNTILAIESNFAERHRMMQKLHSQHIKQPIQFASNSKEGLMELFFFNKSMQGPFPETILISYTWETREFLETLQKDLRYQAIKVFVLIEDNLHFYKEKLTGVKYHGIVNKNLDFKNNECETYLDALDLFLHLLKMNLDKNNRIKYLLQKEQNNYTDPQF